jgi:hypothetical protein
MVLFDLATARLVKEKILLPGVTTLIRLVASVRDRAAARSRILATRRMNSLPLQLRNPLTANVFLLLAIFSP